MKQRQRARLAASASALAGLAVLLAAAHGHGAGAPQKPREQAKVYESTLLGMTGQPFGKVIAAVEGWGFECLDAWEAVDPAPKDVAGHNRKKVKFSKKEIEEIFGAGGAFRVVVYSKLVGRDATTMGTVDAMGMTGGKDASFDIEKHTVIRAVFKDGALLLSKVWPVVDQAGMSGGMLFRR
ncbi:MAG TPA: hypothetical protein PLP83_05935 [Candidatus Aminicenantes bacterium]|nr:hypothetical protein [Candidatus Aminicenantes bacterium]